MVYQKHNIGLELVRLGNDYRSLSISESMIEAPKAKQREELAHRIDDLIAVPSDQIALKTEERRELFERLLVIKSLSKDDEAIENKEITTALHTLARKFFHVGPTEEDNKAILQPALQEAFKGENAAAITKLIQETELGSFSTKEVFELLSGLKKRMAKNAEFSTPFIWTVNNVLSKKEFDPSLNWEGLLKDLNVDLKFVSPIVLQTLLRADPKTKVSVAHLNDSQLSVLFKNFSVYIKLASKQLNKSAESDPKLFKEYFDQLLNHPNLGPRCTEEFTSYFTNETKAKEIVEALKKGGFGLLLSISQSKITQKMTQEQFFRIMKQPLANGKSPLADRENFGTLTIFCSNFFKNSPEGRIAFFEFLKQAMTDSTIASKPHIKSLIDYAIHTPFYKDYLDESQVRYLVLKTVDLIGRDPKTSAYKNNLRALLDHPKANIKAILKDLENAKEYTPEVGKLLIEAAPQRHLKEWTEIITKLTATKQMQSLHHVD